MPDANINIAGANCSKHKISILCYKWFATSIGIQIHNFDYEYLLKATRYCFYLLFRFHIVIYENIYGKNCMNIAQIISFEINTLINFVQNGTITI